MAARKDRTGWSRPAIWEMGLLSPAEWHGKWIARTADTAYHPAPLLRRVFSVKGKVKRARLYISGRKNWLVQERAAKSTRENS